MSARPTVSNSLLILGTSSASGKTVISVGLCRALSNRGLKVAPFKAISVIKARDVNEASHPLHASGIIHHARAARAPFATEMNPVAVWPSSPTTGELFIHGERVGTTGLLTEDMIDMRHLPDQTRRQILEAVDTSLSELLSRKDFIVIEGASSPADQADSEDIPNIRTARLSGAPILLCCQFSKGGAGAAIIGTAQALPGDLRPALRGYVLGDLRDPRSSDYTQRLIEERMGLRRVGLIPHVTVWDGPPDTYPEDEQIYEILADTVSSGIHWNELGGLPSPAR